MHLLRHAADPPPQFRGGVVIIGNFDGLHQGHRAVVDCAAAIARPAGLPFGLLTFEPHPRSVFQPGLAPFRLTPLRAKVRQVEALGLDFMVALRFDQALLRKPAPDFVTEVLIGGLRARHVVAGRDFRFGHGRAGNLELIAQLGAAHGLTVTGVAPVAGSDGLILSSTRVREALINGHPREAAALLGRPWELEGRVEAGARLGRTLGFPTANLGLGDCLRPALGVYAVRAGIDAGTRTIWHDGVANLGRRPTVGGVDERLEVHLFDLDRDLYRRHLRVRLIEFLRPEQRFDGLVALREQIGRDAAVARAVLAPTPVAPGGLEDRNS